MSTARPALEGGTPVRSTPLPYGRQSVDDADVQAVVSALRSDWLTTGPRVAEFEAEFAAAVGATHAVAVANGTAALHAAVFAAGIGAADEAVTTPMTFAATSNCLLYQQARPVFADVEADTLTLDPDAAAAAVSPKTKALIAMDFAGHPAALDTLLALSAERGLVFIEDSAHALGATYRGRRVGSMAALTTFSLHPVKHITTGEGGMVTTNDETLARRARLFRNHGISTEFRERAASGSWLYEQVALGFNYRLTDIQCALGLSQLCKQQAWLARRRAIAARYSQAFAALPEVEPPTVRPDVEPAWHLYVLRLNLNRLRVDRCKVFQALRTENIAVNVHYIPVPWHPYYAGLGYARGAWPVAEREYERLLSLPMFPAMTDADADDVIEAVSKVCRFYRR